jgi:PAT family beta-lactamase induction signal transducer AmpG
LSLAASARSTWERWRDAASVYRDRKQLAILLMGFASGMPLLLTGSVLGYWMSRVGVNLQTIGIFALVGTPYAFKFAWAPLVDHTPLPLLDKWLGRRRSWMLLSQAGILLSVLALAFSNPVVDPWTTAASALAIAFFSATQDIAVDAYRIEILSDEEQGAGSATTQLGYRIALWIVDAMALLLPSVLPWSIVFSAIAALILVGVATTLTVREPALIRPHAGSPRQWLYQAAIAPFAEFMAYRGWALILLFALLYKFGDAIGGTMARPFFNDIGFTGPEIFGVTKSFGIAATILGAIVGGIVVARYGLIKALLIGGILQAMTNLLFAWQAHVGNDIVVLTIAISADNFTGSLGSIAFVAYLSSLCTTGMAGTQYALLTSLMAFGRTTMSAGGGWLAAQSGWPNFWILTTLLAVPGLLLLLWLKRLTEKETPPSATKEGK